MGFVFFRITWPSYTQDSYVILKSVYVPYVQLGGLFAHFYFTARLKQYLHNIIIREEVEVEKNPRDPFKASHLLYVVSVRNHENVPLKLGVLYSLYTTYALASGIIQADMRTNCYVAILETSPT